MGEFFVSVWKRKSSRRRGCQRGLYLQRVRNYQTDCLWPTSTSGTAQELGNQKLAASIMYAMLDENRLSVYYYYLYH